MTESATTKRWRRGKRLSLTTSNIQTLDTGARKGARRRSRRLALLADFPPRVQKQVRQILDAAARRLLADELDREPSDASIPATAGASRGNVNPRDRRPD